MFVLVFLALSTSVLFAGGSSSLNLRYPIVLVHGYAGSDEFIFGIDYFYGIKDALEDQGARVFVVDMSAFSTSSVRAQQLKSFILRVLAITGKNKVTGRHFRPLYDIKFRHGGKSSIHSDDFRTKSRHRTF
jgi:triacylglycerol lipase